MYKCSDEFIVRHSDAMDAGAMRGGALQVSCCAASVRNCCKAKLGAEDGRLVSLQADIAQSINRCADKWGKTKCNSVSVLLESKCAPSSGPPVHLYAVCARAWFNPKYQLWCYCQVVDGSSDAFPFTLRLVSEGTRINPEAMTIKVRTTDELAADIARASLGGTFGLSEMEYAMPEGATDLMSMIVTARKAINLVTLRAPANRALQELRALTSAPGADGRAGAGGMEVRRAVAAARSKADRGNQGQHKRGGKETAPARPTEPGEPPEGVAAQSSAREGSEGGAIDAPLIVGSDEVQVDPFEDFGAEDMAEIVDGHRFFLEDDGADGDADAWPARDAQDPAIVEAVAAMGAGNEQDETPIDDGGGSDAEMAVGEVQGEGPELGASASPDATMSYEPHAEPIVAPPPLELITGPSGAGYFHDRRSRRHCAHISATFNNSVSIKCTAHKNCRTAMAEWKLPSRQDIVLWILNMDAPHPDDTPADAARKAKEHQAQMRALRDSAVRPGRTRQALINEAAAAEAAPL